MSRVRSLVLGAALITGVASASAAADGQVVIPLAPDTYSELIRVGASFAGVARGMAVPPRFTDTFAFTVDKAALVSGAVVSFDMGSLFNVDDLQVRLINQNNQKTDTLAYGAKGEMSQVGFVQVIPDQSYLFEVTGTAKGSSGGYYAFIASLAPVPEPGTFAMMAAGVAAIGFMVMRRRPRG